jgi:signal transduction histidine kinase
VTAVFAHEVRNPINNISTGLQLMALNLPDTDPNQEIIARLQQDCDRLAELMKSVLSYSHPSDYEMEPVDLGALITRMIERMRAKLSRSKIKHHIQIEPDIPLILGNPRALEQVFTNLISNAMQAMGDQEGTLAVKIQAVKTPGRRGHVEVSVADSGPGIPKELLDRIFQPFFTTKPNGTGLGLAITRRIITAHKGNLQVNSFPGGTVFSVQIPEIDPSANIESSIPES